MRSRTDEGSVLRALFSVLETVSGSMHDTVCGKPSLFYVNTHLRHIHTRNMQTAVIHKGCFVATKRPPQPPPGPSTFTIFKDDCLVCGSATEGNTEDLQMLLCDFKVRGGPCNKTMHVKCAGLDSVPVGFWFCKDCSPGRVLGRT